MRAVGGRIVSPGWRTRSPPPARPLAGPRGHVRTRGNVPRSRRAPDRELSCGCRGRSEVTRLGSRARRRYVASPSGRPVPGTPARRRARARTGCRSQFRARGRRRRAMNQPGAAGRPMLAVQTSRSGENWRPAWKITKTSASSPCLTTRDTQACGWARDRSTSWTTGSAKGCGRGAQAERNYRAPRERAHSRGSDRLRAARSGIVSGAAGPHRW